MLGWLRARVYSCNRHGAGTTKEVAMDHREDLPPQVMHALKAGRKIEAIKIYRAETGAGLREAKEYVESIAD